MQSERRMPYREVRPPAPMPPPTRSSSMRRSSSCKVTYDWDGIRKAGTISLEDLHAPSELLEALVELGEALIGPRVTAAESQVFYACADGQTRKFFVTKTRMADLRADCQGLMVQRLVR